MKKAKQTGSKKTGMKSSKLKTGRASRAPKIRSEPVAEIEPGRATSKPFPIVGIGASAGGFEAMSQLTQLLPKDSGMAFVIVQHLDPTHESQLTVLLGRNAPLPITEIKNGMEVEVDHIYVMPPNCELTISRGVLRLTPRKTSVVPHMPVDKFFRSLAEDQQTTSIGVVLSGTGTDGTLGLEAIKGAGGLTLAQDEASSKHFGMPGSAIASGAVDFVFSPDGIAAQLGRIARHPYIARSEARNKPVKHATEEGGASWQKLIQESSGELDTIFSLLRARTGVDFSFYKHTTLKRRIVRRMILHKLVTLESYVNCLESDPAELDALFNDLLINVTEFFRDPQAFQTLQKKVFPKLLKAHNADSALRMWVCGCSTGEEAYSLAISVVEFFEKTRAHRPVQIFATDISEAGIEKARTGIYPENISQDISPERLRRFFTKVEGHYQVHKAIRDMCIFARQNVVVDPPFSNLDLISCRNVMIYLGPLLQRKIIPVFHYALRPNGFLMLGSSETIGTSTDLFSLVNKKNKIYAKKVSFFRPAFEIPNRAVMAEAKELRPPEQAVAQEIKLPDLHQQVDKILLRDFSPAAVVINSQMDVLQFRGRTGNYLEHAPGTASLNLLKMARESLVIDLRSVVTKAMKQDSPVVQRGVQLRHGGSVREICVEVIPFRLTPSSERFFLVLFKESGTAETPESRESRSGAGNNKGSKDRRALERLRTELNATKESLQSIIEEQEATNEELKSANEEIQSSNEELQSTNEELETAKEELQSTNEELTTLNEELQNRNSELTTLNNDLTNLLSSVNIAILMLGNDLTIRRFTPMAERIFNLIPSDMGRRLSDMNRSVLVPDLDESIRDVIDNLTIIEREVQDREGRWYSLRIRPYRTRENKIDGAVILLLDIDELKRALESVLSVVKQPLLTMAPDLRVKKANEHFLKTFGLKAEQVENRLVYQMGSGEWNIPKLQTLFEAILPDNKQVNDYELEGDFPVVGRRKIRLNVRRFNEEMRGLQMIVVAAEVV